MSGDGSAAPTPARPGPGSGFGSSLAGRWSRPHGRLWAAAPIGRMAAGTARTADMVGRSLSARTVVSTRLGPPRPGNTPASPGPQPSAVAIPVPAQMLPPLMSWWKAAGPAAPVDDRVEDWPPRSLLRALPALQRSWPAATAAKPRPGGPTPAGTEPSLPPRGLRRVSGRGSATAAGPSTGPTGGLPRLAPTSLTVRHPAEVKAVGPTLTRRDGARAPSRRATTSSASGGPEAPGPRGRSFYPAGAGAGRLLRRSVVSTPAVRSVIAPAAGPAGHDLAAPGQVARRVGAAQRHTLVMAGSDIPVVRAAGVGSGAPVRPLNYPTRSTVVGPADSAESRAAASRSRGLDSANSRVASSVRPFDSAESRVVTAPARRLGSAESRRASGIRGFDSAESPAAASAARRASRVPRLDSAESRRGPEWIGFDSAESVQPARRSRLSATASLAFRAVAGRRSAMGSVDSAESGWGGRPGSPVRIPVPGGFPRPGRVGRRVAEAQRDRASVLTRGGGREVMAAGVGPTPPVRPGSLLIPAAAGSTHHVWSASAPGHGGRRPIQRAGRHSGVTAPVAAADQSGRANRAFDRRTPDKFPPALTTWPVPGQVGRRVLDNQTRMAQGSTTPAGQPHGTRRGARAAAAAAIPVRPPASMASMAGGLRPDPATAPTGRLVPTALRHVAGQPASVAGRLHSGDRNRLEKPISVTRMRALRTDPAAASTGRLVPTALRHVAGQPAPMAGGGSRPDWATASTGRLLLPTALRHVAGQPAPAARASQPARSRRRAAATVTSAATAPVRPLGTPVGARQLLGAAPGASRVDLTPVLGAKSTRDPATGVARALARPDGHPGGTGRSASRRGERFLETLARHRPDPDRAIPVQLRRLADLDPASGPARRPDHSGHGNHGGHGVTPDLLARVKVRSGPGTSAALRAADRPAATVGNTIFLATPPDNSPRSAEILAHELVHAARPSHRPRFFADDRHSAEESAAVRAGGRAAGLMRAFDKQTRRPGSPEHLTLGTTGLAVGPGASPLTSGAAAAAGGLAQRSSLAGAPLAGPSADTGRHGGGRRAQAGRHRPGPPAPEIPAIGLAAAAGGPASAATAGAPGSLVSRIQRAIQDAPPARPGSAAPGGPPVPAPDPFDPRPGDRPFVRTSSASGGTMVYGTTDTSFPSGTADGGAPISAETLDWIVDAVEERILAELERRGMRYSPGVI